MNKKKLQRGILTVLQIAAILGIAGACGYFLLRYGAYGEREVSEPVETQKIEKMDSSLPDTIRVRIMSNDFQNEYHSGITITSSEKYAVTQIKKEQLDRIYETGALKSGQNLSSVNYDAGAEVCFSPEDIGEDEILWVMSEGDSALTVKSLRREDGEPEYSGSLYLWREEAGIALLNVLPLEEYLYSVVSSEMPSDYPLEAQKAQAVCARTYAVNCIKCAEGNAFSADVNDSVAFQVYNNYGMTERSKQAVDATAGEILAVENMQYYSTSCLSEHRTDLDSDEAFEAFLMKAPEEGAEYDSRWLRWETEISKEDLLEKLAETYSSQFNSSGESGDDVSDCDELVLTVEGRRGDGQVEKISFSLGERNIIVEGEFEIRRILGLPQSRITLMDGSETSTLQLLPSAFFYIDESSDTSCFKLRGGGYGHGNGMSQCGAAAMAEKGMDYKTIIGYYYP